MKSKQLLSCQKEMFMKYFLIHLVRVGFVQKMGCVFGIHHREDCEQTFFRKVLFIKKKFELCMRIQIANFIFFLIRELCLFQTCQ